jgi:hypothetical protein
MPHPRFGTALIVLLCLLMTIGAAAKRFPLKPVPPIVADGIRYSAEGDRKDNYVIATDERTGKQLWRVRVFHNRVHWWRGEEDVQWVFISDMNLVGNALLVRDEKNHCYSVYVETKRVKKHPCDNIPPQKSRNAEVERQRA